MLCSVSNDTPRFEVFSKLNNELMYFLEQSIPDGAFRRELFSNGVVGQACWDNCKESNTRAKNDLTREKFAHLFSALQAIDEEDRRRVLDVYNAHQNLSQFFSEPQLGLLDFLPQPCMKSLKALASHLYCATKDLQAIVDDCAGFNISDHFEVFRQVNGNVCKACGMSSLGPIRANIAETEQWRADYDHQLCKSKYPLLAVHPDNLIPLCDICNQDAKKSKDLFVSDSGDPRPSFYPYAEAGGQYVDIQVGELRDPVPSVAVVWSTEDEEIIRKLDTWNEVYEIKNLVEGRFRSLESVILDEINPINFEHMCTQVADKARPPQEETLKRKAWAFWDYKLFSCLSRHDLAPFREKSLFVGHMANAGAMFILERETEDGSLASQSRRTRAVRTEVSA